ncbi:MAG: Hsp20/alpha crystallin family protein [Acidobacteria bacterium]|nr:Hsp20/alpha crystallin family protein [Acidobacteriota bacterium]MCW5967753.1 Hsp20/alpha crystallin family protein [Blastocatellales bacterium]
MTHNDWRQLRELQDLQERMNRFFEERRQREASREDGEFEHDADWTPPVDIFEADGGIVLKVELPEVNQNDIDIRIDGQRLIISGRREPDPAVPGDRYYRVERRYGRFARSFTLPDAVDRDRIEASYNGGVLKLAMPRRAEKQPRTISVKVK